MDGAGRKIEIFEPFGRALDLTKLILFQPFDFTKWMVIGFAAFLAGLADGTRFGFPNFGSGDFKGDATTRNVADAQALMPWVTAGIIAVVAVIVVVMILLFMWLGSRGRFMFIDCIVRNRGAIEEPWRQYRSEGNSLFLFTLSFAIASFLLALLLALPLLIPFFRTGDFSGFGRGSLVYMISMIALFVVLSTAWALVVWLMVPIMYRRRCRAVAALKEVLRLVSERPAPILLFGLFGIVIAIAGAMVSCLVICLTCCIALIPYIGTLVLLPLYTFYYAYTLLFLRQFGPEFDVWASAGAVPMIAAAADASAPAASVAETPPAAEPPPPPAQLPPQLPPSDPPPQP